MVACHRNWKIGCSVVRDRLPIRYEELVDSLLRLSPHLETLVIANGHLLMSIEVTEFSGLTSFELLLHEKF